MGSSHCSQGDSAQPGTATGSHTLAHVPASSSVALTQKRRQRGSDCSAATSTLLAWATVLAVLKAGTNHAGLDKVRLRGLGCFGHC